VEAVEFCQRWSVATRRGPREGSRKEKDQGRQEGGSAKERSRVSSTKKFLFLVHEYLGSERPVLLKYKLLRDFVYEEAMCERSSGNGLLYAAKAVP
jgi:hypothetical protein